MKWIKAAAVGLVAALVMFVLIQIAIASGLAPFNVPPSAAFLTAMDLPSTPWALFVHFGYGLLGSVLLVAITRNHATVWKGLVLGVALWLVMMVVYSPMIGWGMFGAAEADVAGDHPLSLAPGPQYAVAALVLHLVYGLVVGAGDKWWLRTGEPASAAVHPTRRFLTETVCAKG
ncbi:MAG: hypothetical protein ACOCX4_00110 [Planctomycetota bacterium]